MISAARSTISPHPNPSRAWDFKNVLTSKKRQRGGAGVARILWGAWGVRWNAQASPCTRAAPPVCARAQSHRRSASPAATGIAGRRRRNCIENPPPWMDTHRHAKPSPNASSDICRGLLRSLKTLMQPLRIGGGVLQIMEPRAAPSLFLKFQARDGLGWGEIVLLAAESLPYYYYNPTTLSLLSQGF